MEGSQEGDSIQVDVYQHRRDIGWSESADLKGVQVGFFSYGELSPSRTGIWEF